MLPYLEVYFFKCVSVWMVNTYMFQYLESNTYTCLCLNVEYLHVTVPGDLAYIGRLMSGISPDVRHLPV